VASTERGEGREGKARQGKAVGFSRRSPRSLSEDYPSGCE